MQQDVRQQSPAPFVDRSQQQSDRESRDYAERLVEVAESEKQA